MIIYVVEMWEYGCDWANKITPDMQNVAVDFNTAKSHFNDFPDWAVGVICEYVADSGKWSCSHYFENENGVANSVEFDQIYEAYR